jgi:alanyl-tRNA synthetase
MLVRPHGGSARHAGEQAANATAITNRTPRIEPRFQRSHAALLFLTALQLRSTPFVRLPRTPPRSRAAILTYVMNSKSGNQIREDFLRFFETKQHRRVHSSSLVPGNDPTLLFTNAGMNQFKDIFLGVDKRAYTRATTSQKCVRAGGKHNDLENVGFTRRHHTFFEMLGNFSFGDYFKRDAIAYAWELLTSPEWFGIPQDKLYVTIFAGQGGAGEASVPRDTEAEQFWIETGVPRDRIFDMPAKDNFWQMGETGPCGPCSEIFYDLGLAASEHMDANGQPEDRPFPEDDQRYVEIWNLVFMQFDRAADGTLTPLPKPSIDTGMGLERLAAVLQGKLSNYETDLFLPLIAKAAQLTDYTAMSVEEASVSDAKGAASLRIIADHARAATFLIADGVQPANEGRGYVLRKIMRRGIRHGRWLGQEEPFLYKMVETVREEMGMAYPELEKAADYVSKIVLAEEQQFARVICIALERLEERLVPLVEKQLLLKRFVAVEAGLAAAINSSDDISASYNRVRLNALEQEICSKYSEFKGGLIGNEGGANNLLERPIYYPGEDAFRLYETYGLPLDFMIDAARDAGIEFDLEGFERAKEEEQQRARASWKGGSQKSAAPVYRELPKTDATAMYVALRFDGARVLALVKDGVGVPELRAGETGEAVLDATSFYADSGGQVGDIGWLYASDHQTVVAEVLGCTKPVQGVFAHRIVAKETLTVGDELDTVVNGDNRHASMRNHTATHLLHAALREVLGTHVKQAGSLVNPSRLRFDFSHFAGVADEELEQIEDIVNRQVLANAKVETLVDVPIDVAVNELGAMALFGEKYGDRVRVVTIGGTHGMSTELCGGTHVGATGEIGLIKLVGEQSVSSGVRRLEAVTGTGSLAGARRDAEVARVAGQFLGTGSAEAEALRERLNAQDDEMKRLRRELDEMRMKSAAASTANAAASAVEVKGVKVLAQRVDGIDKGQMRSLVDSLRSKLGEGVVVLGSATPEGKVALIVGVTKELTGRVQAGKVVGQIAAKVGGKGGGRPDLAEAGGSDVAALDAALESATDVVAALLG